MRTVTNPGRICIFAPALFSLPGSRSQASPRKRTLSADEERTKKQQRAGAMSFDRRYNNGNNDNVLQTPQERAEDLRLKHRGRWMVIWSVYETRFIAYPVWIGGGGHMLKARTEAELERQMSEIEQASRGPG
ncbi:hypothetical protein ACGFNU_29735 [Spirillospora sp. NPDC048911]|uniref:hypothetical protein n=1 Tax=Spirillospora sp. NPDC048911 TaxID=3364527 RepID=UPI00371828A6